MAKLTTDKALSILIDSEQAKKVLKPSYIRQVKHRLKTGKNLELSKKIEILEKLGAVANELTWNVKTNLKNYSTTASEIQKSIEATNEVKRKFTKAKHDIQLKNIERNFLGANIDNLQKMALFGDPTATIDWTKNQTIIGSITPKKFDPTDLI